MISLSNNIPPINLADVLEPEAAEADEFLRRYVVAKRDHMIGSAAVIATVRSRSLPADERARSMSSIQRNVYEPATDDFVTITKDISANAKSNVGITSVT